MQIVLSGNNLFDLSNPSYIRKVKVSAQYTQQDKG